jgi:signal transduction histidine kinase
LPLVSADRHLLFEAISNLVDNGIKFARGTVSITALQRDATLIIAVSDDGPGIPAGERDAALRRFHRGAKAAGYPGTGLGLSIAAAILALHGFSLELDDAGPGLVARIHIPLG